MDSKKGLFKKIVYSFEEMHRYVGREHLPSSMKVAGIHRAVLEGALQRVEHTIASGGSVNKKLKGLLLTPLHMAVMKNDLEILDYLLARDGIEVNGRCYRGKTPLYYAAALGRTESVEKLCRAGADVNLSDCERNSPLHVSVRHPDVCHLLIRNGAQLDAYNNFNYTPLYDAVQTSSLEALCMLLYYNADVNTDATYGKTPLTFCFTCNDLQIPSTLLEYEDNFNRMRPKVCPPLHWALTANSPLAKVIIERGADVNYGDHPDLGLYTCAFIACLSRPVVDVSTFRMVWERLRYNHYKDTIHLSYFLNNCDEMPNFLSVILESDNFQPIVEYFCKWEFSSFIDIFAERKFDLDQLAVLACRLLQEGFRPTSNDICAVFRHYGYCELFTILLYMDIDNATGWLSGTAFCRLLCDVDYDLEDAVADLSVSPQEDLLQWFEYTVNPLLISALTVRYSDDDQVCRILTSLPRVPSLIELSRNAARKYVRHVLKASTCCQFYTAINSLPLPSVCKSILKFERKIYVVEQ